MIPRRLPAAVCGSLLLANCYLPPPPDSEERQRSTPLFDAVTAVPSPLGVQPVEHNDTFSVNVRVIYDEPGERVLVLAYADDSFIWDQKVDPGTKDEPEPLSFVWTIKGLDPGCHRYELLVTAPDNVIRHLPDLELEDAQAAGVIWWWLNVDDGVPPNALQDCPPP